MKFEETYLNDNILDALYDMRFEDIVIQICFFKFHQLGACL